MEKKTEENLNNLCLIVLSIIYLTFSYQMADNNGSIPIIDWLPEFLFFWAFIIGMLGGFVYINGLIINIIIHLGGGLISCLVATFGFHAAWVCFLISIKK
jgi:hypothetical protein